MKSTVSQISPHRIDGLRALAALPDAAFIVDAHGEITWANERCAEGLGWELDDLVGSNVLDFAHPDDAVLVATSLESVQAKGVGTHMEVRTRSATGEWRSIELIGRDCLDDPDIGAGWRCGRSPDAAPTCRHSAADSPAARLVP